MSVLALAGLVGVIFDLCTYGVCFKSSSLVSLIDSINFCISYRSTTQVLRGHQSWFRLLCVTVFLKRVAGWLGAVCLGIVPSIRDDLAPICIVVVAFILVQKTPNDFAYKDMRSPATKAILSIGGAIFRWRKLLLVVDMFGYSMISWKAFLVAVLVVDGSSASKGVDYWWEQSRRKGSVQIGSTLQSVASFSCHRIFPTWFSFSVIAYMADSGSNSLNTNVGVWMALFFYLQNFSVFGQLRSLATYSYHVNGEVSGAPTKKSSENNVEDVVTTDCSGSDSSDCHNVAQPVTCHKRNNDNTAVNEEQNNGSTAAGSAENAGSTRNTKRSRKKMRGRNKKSANAP
eukprot:GEMP01022164.1.p1 GENE.GEMP01022164.1~~GEMP01022164.1.p1  ORF type:complete len:350 (+),score=49.35 GEMP01022164.1:23-1051(+)